MHHQLPTTKHSRRVSTCSRSSSCLLVKNFHGLIRDVSDTVSEGYAWRLRVVDIKKRWSRAVMANINPRNYCLTRSRPSEPPLFGRKRMHAMTTRVSARPKIMDPFPVPHLC